MFSNKVKENILIIFFLLPAIILFLTFKIIPIIQGLWISFWDYSPIGESEWIGFKNFRTIFSDTKVFIVFFRTLYYVMVTSTLSIILGIIVAIIVRGQSIFINFVRTAIIIPSITALVGVALIWKGILSSGNEGLLNQVLAVFGVGNYGFLSSPEMALNSIMSVSIWRNIPYNAIIFVSGLASVDHSLYEAAELDGANKFQKIWYIDLPALRPTISVLATLAIIRGLQTFAEIDIMTGGGPSGSTKLIMTVIYEKGFALFEYGSAAAMSSVLFLIILLLTIVKEVYFEKN